VFGSAAEEARRGSDFHFGCGRGASCGVGVGVAAASSDFRHSCKVSCTVVTLLLTPFFYFDSDNKKKNVRI
jgi:hypothetical protein